MVDDSKIYDLTEEWLEKVNKGSFEDFKKYRSDFAKLEKETFGDVMERVKKPLAMKYDLVRNSLVRHSGPKDAESIKMANEYFSEIEDYKNKS